MKKFFKKFGIILVTVCLLFNTVSVSAAQTNVTSKYKTSVTKFLREFDGFLGYSAYTTNQKFKYDDYTKTTMLLYAHSWVRTNDTVKSAVKKLTPKMKHYFTSGKIRLVKSSTPQSNNPAYVFCNKNGRVTYRGGDWGGEYPRGYVTKVVKSGSNYIVNYNVYIIDEFYNTRGPLMAKYQITLKRSSGHFKFRNIKQTKLNRWYQ